ncbi:HD domain-containing protein [Limnochorda sp.]|uniref:HD domain-containing protein n=1 Tax=Limnochorda sp. TaxID=1940279 RepID=UPI0017E3CF98|nr:phosphohydrolase [Bacillota bacterium]MBO2518127.1 phosphohydrolase [Bacillota bacterium]NMA72484.1 bifunctional (p)ppGpp synthetase/guanosine-3',5'-bis(diphosphate) 3'-pyrophosphohydrolase [Bacillota bacterium]
MPEPPSPQPVDAERFAEAVRFALQAHGNQYRKGSPAPFVTHPVAVAGILAQYGCSEAVVLAAVLHDVLEDTPVTAEELEARFGPRVTALVQAVTEVKTIAGRPVPWEERKASQLAHLQATDDLEAVLLKAADVLHNVTTIIRDLRLRGHATWSRFRRGATDQLRYYRRVAEVLGERLGNHPLAAELKAQVEELHLEAARAARGPSPTPPS